MSAIEEKLRALIRHAMDFGDAEPETCAMAIAREAARIAYEDAADVAEAHTTKDRVPAAIRARARELP